VFKKAAIVLAVSAAGLLAVSPLAFAGDYSGDGGHGHHGHHGHDHDGDHDDHDGDHGDHDGDHDGHGHGHGRGHDEDSDYDGGSRTHVQSGLVNLQDVGVQVPVQACNNSILTGVLGILSLGQHSSDSHDGKCSQRNSDN
jgi:hypothetical protein